MSGCYSCVCVCIWLIAGLCCVHMKDKVVRQHSYTSHYPCLSRGHRKYICRCRHRRSSSSVYTQHTESQRDMARTYSVIVTTYIHRQIYTYRERTHIYRHIENRYIQTYMHPETHIYIQREDTYIHTDWIYTKSRHIHTYIHTHGAKVHTYHHTYLLESDSTLLE